MRKETKIVTYTCDVCHKECNPISEVSIPFSYNMDMVNTLTIKTHVDIPYCNEDTCICRDCLIRLIETWIRQERSTNGDAT